MKLQSKKEYCFKLLKSRPQIIKGDKKEGQLTFKTIFFVNGFHFFFSVLGYSVIISSTQLGKKCSIDLSNLIYFF